MSQNFKAILDIPDAAILATSKLRDLIAFFSRKTGLDPDVICLPLYDEGGPQFPNYGEDNKLWKSFDLADTISEIRKNYPDVKVYLCIMPELPGFKMGNVTRRTQFGNESPSLCIVNPGTQEILKAFIDEAVETYKPDGIVFDIVEIYGQTGRDELVEVTCFCEYCRRELEYTERFANMKELSRVTSPFNLVLTSTGTTVRYITAKRNMEVDDLVELSFVRGFITNKTEEHTKWAQTILQYIKARSNVTGAAIGKIAGYIKEQHPDLRTGAIICSSDFDWTSGTGIDGLAHQVDEVWLDINELQEGDVPPNLEVYYYTADRARYYIDAFFEVASDYNYIKRRLEASSPRDLNRSLAEKRESAIRVQNLHRFTVLSTRNKPFLNGVVGCALDAGIVSKVENALRPIIGEIIEREFGTQQTSEVTKTKMLEYVKNMVLAAAQEGGALSYQRILSIAAQTGVAEPEDLQALFEELRS